MEFYETEDDYTVVEIQRVIDWFNDNIGTDYDMNESASGEDNQYYLVCCDMTPKEVKKMRIFELKFREENKDANI